MSVALAIFGDSGAHREFSNWRFPGLCEPVWPGADRLAALFAGCLGKRRSKAQVPDAIGFATKPAIVPAGAALAELTAVAGLRWTIEECFQRAKTDLGLDHCEARSWHGWHRHMSLVMAAAAFLAKLAADMRRTVASGKPNKTSPFATIAA